MLYPEEPEKARNQKGGRKCRAFRSPSATGPRGPPPLARARRGGAGRHDEARETLNQPAQREQNQLDFKRRVPPTIRKRPEAYYSIGSAKLIQRRPKPSRSA